MSLSTPQFSKAAVCGLLLVFGTAGWSQEEAVGPDIGAEEPVENRFETHIQFLDRIKLDEFDLAASVGTRLIELVEADEGPASADLAEVLSEVGEVQRLAEQYDAAERSLLRSLEIYQSLDGPMSAKLIKPMVSLGMNYNDSEKYGSAVVVLNQARSIDRRNFGLLDEGQIGIIDNVTESYKKLGQFDKANQQQVQALQLSQRIHGIETMDSLPAIFRYATFLRSVSAYDPARAHYNRAIRIIHDQRGKLDPELANPLREIGNTFREQGIAEGLGASALKRSIEILEQNEPLDHVNLALSYRDLGDWYTAFSRVGKGAEEYEKAWQLLAEGEADSTLRDAWFDTRQPKFVYYVPPSQRGLREKGSEPGLKEGFVSIQFDLLPNGRTDNVTVLESDPANGKDESTLRSMRNSRLRPNLVDGKVVRTDGLQRRYLFTYKPDAL